MKPAKIKWKRAFLLCRERVRGWVNITAEVYISSTIIFAGRNLYKIQTFFILFTSLDLTAPWSCNCSLDPEAGNELLKECIINETRMYRESVPNSHS